MARKMSIIRLRVSYFMDYRYFSSFCSLSIPCSCLTDWASFLGQMRIASGVSITTMSERPTKEISCLSKTKRLFRELRPTSSPCPRLPITALPAESLGRFCQTMFQSPTSDQVKWPRIQIKLVTFSETA